MILEGLVGMSNLYFYFTPNRNKRKPAICLVVMVTTGVFCTMKGFTIKKKVRIIVRPKFLKKNKVERCSETQLDVATGGKKF